MKKPPFTVTENNITIFVNGKSEHVRKDHVNFYKIRLALKEQRWDDAISLVSVRSAIAKSGRITLDGDKVFLDGIQLHTSLAKRIVYMATDGFDVEPMLTFYNNLLSNPSKRAVDELYGFLEVNDLPITEDGYFLAYKKVRADFKDIYTGKIDNSPGKLVTQERNTVDEDKDRTCSSGLHFASMSYLKHYGVSNRSDYKVVIVKINPSDVVSIPSDYNNAKGRCCEYLVVKEHPYDHATESLTKSMYSSDGQDLDDRDYGDIESRSDFRYDDNGFDQDGFDVDGYDEDGYDKNGYNDDGYDRKGYDRNKFHQTSIVRDDDYQIDDEDDCDILDEDEYGEDYIYAVPIQRLTQRLRDSKGRFIKKAVPAVAKRDSKGRFIKQ